MIKNSAWAEIGTNLGKITIKWLIKINNTTYDLVF